MHVAVGLPDIFFYNGHYYRERKGLWERSLTGRGGWNPAQGVPASLVKAKRAGPGPAKHRK